MLFPSTTGVIIYNFSKNLNLSMEPRTLFFLLTLSSLFYCTLCGCINHNGIKRRMFPALLNPPSCTIEITAQAICNHTDNPALCISSIKPYLPPSGNVTPADVLRMEIKACYRYTETSFEVAIKVAKDPKTPEAVAECLEVCRESYAEALDNLKSAEDAVVANDAGTLNSMLSAALTNFETCEDAFEEEPGVRSPMATYDARLSNLASNCLAVSLLI